MSAIFENIRMALIGLQSNKLRAILTMLGITIGVMAVIILVSLGQGVSSYIRNQFLSNGANLMIIFASQNEDGEIERLTMEDVEALSDTSRITEANIVMGTTNSRARVSYEDQSAQTSIQGVTPAYMQLYTRELESGNFFTQDDVDSFARVAVIGQTTKDRFFADTNPIGRSLRINNISFRVVGVLEELSSSGPGASNDIVLVPLTTAQTRLSGERIISGDRPIAAIFMQAKSENSTETLTQQIREVLREGRGLKAGEQDNFTIIAQTEILDSLTQIIGLLTVFLGVVAGISLLVGGIGIMNIMLVTVTERTREIGLRKAVGARNGDILLQFLTESLVMSLTGGVIGVMFAWLGTDVIGLLVPDLSPSIQLSSVIMATGISITVGVFFGIYPAQRAAKLNPIDALRYE